ncbi:dihydrofolate reductase family protein [Gordonia sp. (in: high G+C Gram-positive bacteria)]|uniref:dihydrofolate reductase family protein n=1 Tax=Gordonia sp. (in: high G+C Gram-positive bacteria) TaxID=84139 RepID=UPI003BB69AB7
MTPLDDVLDTYTWPDSPWLRTNFVLGIDGSLSRGHSSAGLSSPADNALLHRLRATADVVLVGASTAVAENYIGIKLPDSEASARRDRGQGPPPPLAVVTRSGRIGHPQRFLTDTITDNFLILTSDDSEATDAASAAVDASDGSMRLIHAPSGIRQAVDALKVRGLRHVVCEGGPRLAAALVDTGLVDELCVTMSPEIGGEGRTCHTHTVPNRYAPSFCGTVDHFLFTRWTRIPGESD